MSVRSYPIDVLVLAAGNSTRLPGETPKQFRQIKFDGQERQMWRQVASAVSLSKRLAVAVRDKTLVQATSDVHVIEVGKTRGQAETLYRALWSYDELRDGDFDLAVLNCDNGFLGKHLDLLIHFGKMHAAPTASVVEIKLPEETARWSTVNDFPTFHYAEEKTGLSKWGLAGAYYFPSVAKLRASLVELLERTDKEPYLSQVYDHMTGQKVAIATDRAHWLDWGTTEALAEYERSLRT